MRRLQDQLGWSPARLVSVISVSVLLAVALWSPAGGHSGTSTHLWNGHLKPMGQPGTINATGNPVHWTKLKGVPAGFADGADDDLPDAFSKTATSTGLICNAGCNEGSLPLPAGRWAVFAKIVALQTDIYETEMFVRCELRAGDEFDETWVDNTSNYAGRAVIQLQGIVTLDAAASITLFCSDDAVGDVHGEDLSILAIKVGD